ncbi:hypothetical protein HPB51_002407 [Rhipicephalus microplus]|uniref:Aldehyde dehydrogenase domain-containing protein n=1 Tax=Rhipicephalus microplus TaxID=6941 RepID=A0A9J6DSM8_RHIMP|nr:hypothetical protein HPB51_002407 [Rhipicephalus microplus]
MSLLRAIPQQTSNVLHYTVRSAVGVVAVIVPWNMPLYMLTFKLAPAMVYGNTVVAKPSELTSVTAWMLAKVFVDAGLPAGVVNFVFGYGQIVGDALVRHPNTKAISFTGSTKTGTTIAQVAGATRQEALAGNHPMYGLQCSLKFYRLGLSLLQFINLKEKVPMGGKNAAIVFEDADFKKCIATLIKASFLNQGEICLCTSRIYIHKKIYQKFTDTFVQEARKLKVGPPQSESVFMGALVSKEHLDKVKFYIKLAMEDGGKVLCGGLREEPELPKENKNVGTIWCNCWMVRHLHMPFGGMKMSGVGREGTDASKEFYTEVKSVCLDYSVINYVISLGEIVSDALVSDLNTKATFFSGSSRVGITIALMTELHNKKLALEYVRGANHVVIEFGSTGRDRPADNVPHCCERRRGFHLRRPHFDGGVVQEHSGTEILLHVSEVDVKITPGSPVKMGFIFIH